MSIKFSCRTAQIADSVVRLAPIDVIDLAVFWCIAEMPDENETIHCELAFTITGDGSGNITPRLSTANARLHRTPIN